MQETQVCLFPQKTIARFASFHNRAAQMLFYAEKSPDLSIEASVFALLIFPGRPSIVLPSKHAGGMF